LVVPEELLPTDAELGFEQEQWDVGMSGEDRAAVGDEHELRVVEDEVRTKPGTEP
jgi:hypothetical protein